MDRTVLLESSIAGLPVRRGKVRDVYDLGETLLLVSTDRISAFDYILPNGIPDKGRVLTQISRHWFQHLQQPNHMLSTDLAVIPLPDDVDRIALEGRTMWVKKTQVVPIECVVRGYLAGSGWKEYQQTQAVCGETLPEGLIQASRLSEPIFTPATKAESGHDENISFARMADLVGTDTAKTLRERSIQVYLAGASAAEQHGILIADTKFEWGWQEGELILIDEVLTPDSSRFWPAESYCPGQSPPSFDKQFVRDWLEQSGWDKNSPPPRLPDDVVQQTRSKYREAFEKLTGAPLD
jgi:phosphoribosylaminoimidazole-succinocarboxamide synthase